MAYWGAALAMFSAPANDCSSCASVLSLTWLLFGDAAIARGDGRRVAGGQERAEDRLHDGAAEVALQVGRARRHAGALRGPNP